MAKVTISFMIEKNLKQSLQKLAKEENRSLSNYVSTVLLKHVKAKETKKKSKK